MDLNIIHSASGKRNKAFPLLYGLQVLIHNTTSLIPHKEAMLRLRDNLPGSACFRTGGVLGKCSTTDIEDQAGKSIELILIQMGMYGVIDNLFRMMKIHCQKLISFFGVIVMPRCTSGPVCP